MLNFSRLYIFLCAGGKRHSLVYYYRLNNAENVVEHPVDTDSSGNRESDDGCHSGKNYVHSLHSLVCLLIVGHGLVCEFSCYFRCKELECECEDRYKDEDGCECRCSGKVKLAYSELGDIGKAVCAKTYGSKSGAYSGAVDRKSTRLNSSHD